MKLTCSSQARNTERSLKNIVNSVRMNTQSICAQPRASRVTCGKLNHFSARCPNRNAQRSTQYVPQRRDRDRGKRPKSYNVKQVKASNEDDIDEDTDTDETTDEDCDFVNKVTVFGVVISSCVDSVAKRLDSKVYNKW